MKYVKPSLNILFLIVAPILVYSKEKIVRYNDPSISLFPSSVYTNEYLGKITNVKSIVQLGNNSVVIGTINLIVMLSLDLKVIKKVLQLEPTNEEKKECEMFGLKVCQNSIASMHILPDGKLLACSYALTQTCWTLDENLDITNAVKREDLPHTGNSDATVLFSDPFILVGYQRLSKSKFMYSVKKNFDEPNFVSSYNFDDSGYAYFFLSERAIGSDNRQFIYSRVTRMCKHDSGQHTLLPRNLVSVLKAHLVCKKKGALVPVYYDELQSTHEVTIDNERYIYGVFITFSESAICRYKVQDIIDVFDHSDLLVKDKDGVMKSVEMTSGRNTLSRKGCPKNFSNTVNSVKDYSQFIKVKEDVLLAENINAKTDDNEALFTLNQKFTSMSSHIVTDEKTGNKVVILFVGTVDGYVYKVAMGEKVRILEKTQVFEKQNPVLKVASFEDMVYASGANGVSSFSVQRCSSYMLCSECLMNEDPYCSWQGSSCVLKSTVVGEENVTKPEQCPPVPNDLKCSIIQDYRGTLRCQVSKSTSTSTTPKVIGWSVDSQEIGATDQGYTIISEPMKSVLIINNVGLMSTGNYGCIIETDQHRSSCSFKLEPQESLSSPSTFNTSPSKSKPILTTEPSETTTHASTISAASQATDVTAIITPSTAPVTVNNKMYFTAFIGTLILLLIILLILLAFLLRRMCKRRKSSMKEGHKSPAGKLNGLSPTKKGKYDVSDEKNDKEVVIEMSEDSMLLSKDEKDNDVGKEPSDDDEKTEDDKANIIT